MLLITNFKGTLIRTEHPLLKNITSKHVFSLEISLQRCVDNPFSSTVMGHLDTLAIRQIKLLYSSSRPYYSLPSHNFLSLLLVSPLPSSIPLWTRPSPCKRWVTTGSISSQQSGLKFHKSPDAYFIVPWSLSIMLYLSCCPSPFTSSFICDFFSIFVYLKRTDFRTAYCTHNLGVNDIKRACRLLDCHKTKYKYKHKRLFADK